MSNTVYPYFYRVDFVGVSAGAPTTFHYASQGYALPPAHPLYPKAFAAGRLTQPLLLTRNLYGQAQTYGPSEIASGTIELENSDGGVDSLLNYTFDNQPVFVYRVDPTDLVNNDVLVFFGFLESMVVDAPTATLTVRDATYMLDRPLQPTKYAGTNSLPNGLEGTPSDIQGKPKPIVYGQVWNIEPALVNTSRLIYQMHDTALGGGAALSVYDMRSLLTGGFNRSISEFTSAATVATVSSVDTIADTLTFGSAHGFVTGDPVHTMSTVAVPAGVLDTQYYYVRAISTTVLSLHPTSADASGNTNKVDITDAGGGTITVAKNRTPFGVWDLCSDVSGSYIRLGATPAGKVTLDITNPALGGTAWYQVAAQLLNRFGTVNGYTLGVDNRITDGYATYSGMGAYWNEETTFFEALQLVVKSFNGSIQCYPTTPPSTSLNLAVQRLYPGGTEGTAPLLIDKTCILGVPTIIQNEDAERGILPWSFVVDFELNNTVMGLADMAGSATVADSAFVAQQYRSINFSLPGILTQFPNAPQMTFDTLLLNSTDVNAHINYLIQLYLQVRRMYGVQLPISMLESLTRISGGNLYHGLMLNWQMFITYPRYGLDLGVHVTPVGITLDYQKHTADLILWG